MAGLGEGAGAFDEVVAFGAAEIADALVRINGVGTLGEGAELEAAGDGQGEAAGAREDDARGAHGAGCGLGLGGRRLFWRGGRERG